MTKIRFRDFVLTPEEKARLFEKYAKEAGSTSLKALRSAGRNPYSQKDFEVPPLDPNQVAGDLGRAVEFKYRGARYIADGATVGPKQQAE